MKHTLIHTRLNICPAINEACTIGYCLFINYNLYHHKSIINNNIRTIEFESHGVYKTEYHILTKHTNGIKENSKN